MLTIVHKSLANSINAAIDKELDGRPCDDESREYLFNALLAHFDEHGVIPSFTLTPKEKSQ